VADPGFDLRGGRGICRRGVGGGGGRKSSESVVGWNKSHCYRVLAIFLLKLCFKLIASEASEEKKCEKLAFWALKNHRSAAVRGGRAPGAPPPGSASALYSITEELGLNFKF